MQPHGRVYRPVNDTIETTCTLWDTSYFTINDLIFEFTEPSKKPENEQRLREIQNIKRISKTLVNICSFVWNYYYWHFKSQTPPFCSHIKLLFLFSASK